MGSNQKRHPHNHTLISDFASILRKSLENGLAFFVVVGRWYSLAYFAVIVITHKAAVPIFLKAIASTISAKCVCSPHAMYIFHYFCWFFSSFSFALFIWSHNFFVLFIRSVSCSSLLVSTIFGYHTIHTDFSSISFALLVYFICERQSIADQALISMICVFGRLFFLPLSLFSPRFFFLLCCRTHSHILV